MFDVIVGSAIILCGLIALTSAPHISALEKRLADSHPWTRVTGWYGTPKGVLAWHLVGVLLLTCGAMCLTNGWIRSHGLK
jgi:hypothetical protein